MRGEISGDAITVDYAGTDAQVPRAINCAFCYTYAMTMYGIKVCTTPATLCAAWGKSCGLG